jgi:hypothetical protein
MMVNGATVGMFGYERGSLEGKNVSMLMCVRVITRTPPLMSGGVARCCLCVLALHLCHLSRVTLGSLTTVHANITALAGPSPTPPTMTASCSATCRQTCHTSSTSRGRWSPCTGWVGAVLAGQLHMLMSMCVTDAAARQALEPASMHAHMHLQPLRHCLRRRTAPCSPSH